MINKNDRNFFILLIGIGSLAYTISLTFQPFLTAIVGGMVGYVGFWKIHYEIKGNFWPKLLFLLAVYILITGISVTGLAGYCYFSTAQRICQRNLFILSCFPMYIAIVLYLIVNFCNLFNGIRQ